MGRFLNPVAQLPLCNFAWTFSISVQAPDKVCCVADIHEKRCDAKSDDADSERDPEYIARFCRFGHWCDPLLVGK
jgi:hypothetical protein